MGGSSPAEGLLQVFIGGLWGTICRRGWGRKSADVACRLLGYTRSVRTVGGARWSGVETQALPVWLDGVKCRGDEDSLLDCPQGPIGTHQCGHSTDVGLICSSKYSHTHTLYVYVHVVHKVTIVENFHEICCFL